MAVSFHTRVIRDAGELMSTAPVPAQDQAKVALARLPRRDHGIRVSNRVAVVAATALAGTTVYIAIGAMTWLWRQLRRSA